jgi:hypothetical protein
MVVQVGTWTIHRHAVVDTGSSVTLVPSAIWQSPWLDGQIDWLDAPPPADAIRTISLLGARYPFRLGRLTMTAIGFSDSPDPALGPRPVVAALCDDAPPLRPLPSIVVGLRHGLLDGRRLVLEPDAPRAYLEDR